MASSNVHVENAKSPINDRKYFDRAFSRFNKIGFNTAHSLNVGISCQEAGVNDFTGTFSQLE